VLPSLRATVEVRMEPTPIEMPPVTVTAERPLVQRDVTGTMYRVASVEIERLPVDTIQEVVELQPGVVSGGHIRGGRTDETLYLLDGVPVQDPTAGMAAIALPKSAITELNVHTGGFDAAYGNALSGVVHIITRRGTNRLRSMVRYDRDDLGEPFGGTEHSGRSQLEGMISGPLVRDRAFWLIAADHVTDNTRWWQDFQHTTLETPYQNSWNLFARTDFYLSETLRLAIQGVTSHEEDLGYEWRWRFNLEGLPASWRDSGRLALTLNHMISPAVFYDLQLSQFIINRGMRRGPRATVESDTLWSYDTFLQYVEPDGGKRLWWFRGEQTITSGRGAITAQIGRHRLRAGFEVSLYDLTSDLLKVEPQTTFYGLPLPDEPPLDYSHTYEYQPRTGGFFLQDTYESGDGLILNIGLRYDWLDPRASRPVVEWVPTTAEEFEQEITAWVPADRKAQISPRIGLAFPLPERTWFLFNYGQFFQVPLFDQLYSGLDLDLTRGLRVLVGNPDLEHERTKSYEFSLRRELNDRSVASLTYFFKESFNLVDTKTFLSADSRALEDGFTQYVNLPLARSSGAEAAFEQRITDGIGLKVAYTFMTARGQAETGLSGLNYLQWGFEPPRTMHFLSWDQRHTLLAEVMGRMGGVDYDLIARFNSPRPYTYAPSATGVLPEGTVVEPNNERMKEIFLIDLRIRKRIPLTIGGRTSEVALFADIRNLTDRKNIVWIASDGRVGGELGDPGAWRIGRRTRIGLEVRF
jgi:outer membrane receptor protein involved in Fe transport